MTQSSQPKRGDVLVLVGTRKGGFILSSEPTRKHWSVSEPQFSGGARTVGKVWRLEPGRTKEPGLVYAG